MAIATYQPFLETLTAWCGSKNLPAPLVVAATKYATPDQIADIVSQGAIYLGENRIQSAQEKLTHPTLSGLHVSWHFIGHLQSNKVAMAIKQFDCIQSGDRLSILEALNTEAGIQKKKQDILIQVNPAKEASKHGFFIEDVYTHSKTLFAFPNLRVVGIMAMAPYTKNPEEVRPYFRETARLFNDLRSEHTEMTVLSMGMSHDYRIAIEEGATMIRVGSLLFEGAVK
jgi:pyridoxal phosphate enzyme (YggS family)